MKHFHSNSALLFIFTFLFYCIFIFYLIQQKYSGNIIINNIFNFNIFCLILSFSPFYLQRFKNKKEPPQENNKPLSIYEEKQRREEHQKQLEVSPTLRKRNYLQSIYLGYVMAALMMSFILMLDK